ncbi:HlyC/CorC family transporter [Desulfoferrobacter suflitae]|uniref:HlyC/CorC family transporter n=1 Tax=Desulfoferrobacter suflitae TaxID=2865782 RepID=UPI002164AF79|nr:CNNM domain-containing protein [Desulfoferrobacter suflitae]MCK8600416.1 CNNM domain-containing protein [Desulfoferrobacter suflitae]
MIENWVFNAIVLLLLLLISAFFSGSETALMAVNQVRMRHLAKKDRRAALVSGIVQKPQRLLGTLLLCNNLVNVALSALGTATAIALAGERGVIYATFFITLALLVVGEITPKTIAAYHSERISVVIAPVIFSCIKIFYPIVHLLSIVSNTLIRMAGLQQMTGAKSFTAEEIESLIEVSGDEGGLERDKQDMLLGVLTLERTTVGDIMVPIQDVVSIPIESTYYEVLEAVQGTQFSRYPVYEQWPSDILGFIHVRDLLMQPMDEKFSVRKIMRKPHFIPELRSVRQQFAAFQRRRSHLSFVVDEYGNVVGLLTMEDILEEIVGEIEDEYDRLDSEVEELADGSYLVRGRVPVRDLNRRLRLDLPEGDVRTVAGLIIKELGRIARLEDTVTLKRCRFSIIALKGKSITWVRLWILDGETPSENDLRVAAR